MHVHLNSYDAALKGERSFGVSRKAALWAGGALLAAGGFLTAQAVAENMDGYAPVHAGPEAHMESSQLADYEGKIARGGILIVLGAANLGGARLLRRWRDAYADAGEQIIHNTLYADPVLRHSVADAVERIRMRHDRQWGYYD